MKKGFTLIEILVVILIISLLATIALFGIGKAQAAARDAQRQQIMNGIRTALERYYADLQAYPASGTTFYTLINTTLSSYLGSVPKDPCGGATIPASGSVTCGSNTVTYSFGSPVAGQCSGSALPNGYQLTLTKEAGGTSYFCSPQ